jgi:hypothetical protein
MKMQPLKIDNDQGGVTLLCKHREEWPPAHARLPQTPVQLRQSGAIDEAKYQQLQTWQKVCGLLTMQAEKCSVCPLALCASDDGTLVPFAPSEKNPATRLPPFARAKKGVVR